MRRVVVFEHLMLDGVIQAPGRADEDRRDGLVGEYVLLIHPLVLGSGAEDR
jgi:hypothetical protein